MQPDSEWEEIDFVLFEAHAVWKAERSEQTGWPIWLTRSADARLGWAVEEMEDAAQRALEEWDESNQGKKRRKGVSRYAVPIVADGEEHLLYGGLTREAHLSTMTEEAVPDDDPSAGLDIDRRPPKGGWNPKDYG